MALETRQRGGLYLYRSRRVGDRVIKQYAGAGHAALLAQMLDEQERARAQAERDARRDALAAFEADEAPLADLCRRAELLARGALLGAGYRRHDRGAWRRRRGEEPDHD